MEPPPPTSSPVTPPPPWTNCGRSSFLSHGVYLFTLPTDQRKPEILQLNLFVGPGEGGVEEASSLKAPVPSVQHTATPPPHKAFQGMATAPNSQPDPPCSFHLAAGEGLVALPWERPQL